MRSLEKKKLLTIITSNQLEEMILKRLTPHGTGGYTVVRARTSSVGGPRSETNSDSGYLQLNRRSSSIPSRRAARRGCG